MIVAVVPARKLSARVPRKNMKRLAGSPLIVWTLEAATSARLVERIIVSSDDPDLMALAQLYAKVETIWRDPALAGDEVPDHPVVMDALYKSSVPLADEDVVLFLRPTAPFRKPEEINLVAELLLAHPSTDSVRSVIRPKFHPQKAYLWSEYTLVRYTSDHKANHPSQTLEPIAYPTGFIDGIRVRTLRAGDMEGTIIRPWLSPPERGLDLDTLEDWEEAEQLCRAHNYGPGRIQP
jgi:CMP-N-acetylneuraminic acid synthetase